MAFKGSWKIALINTLLLLAGCVKCQNITTTTTTTTSTLLAATDGSTTSSSTIPQQITTAVETGATPDMMSTTMSTIPSQGSNSTTSATSRSNSTVSDVTTIDATQSSAVAAANTTAAPTVVNATTINTSSAVTTAATTTTTPNITTISSTTKVLSTTTAPTIITTAASTTTTPTITTTAASTTTTPTIITTVASTTGGVAPSPSIGETLIAVFVVLALICIIILILVYCYWKGKLNSCLGLTSVDGEEMPLSSAVSVGSNRWSMHAKNKFAVGKTGIRLEDFEKEYAKKISDDNRLFRTEFLAAQQYTGDTHESRKAENLPKNRYDNIVPFDSTRVLLGGSRGDYINANYVSGYRCVKKWIASQGPKEETFEDFWQMIWEQKTLTIIMITNLVENGKLKCHKYWPDESTNGAKDSCQYGIYTVTLVEKKDRNFYVQRTFVLKHGDEDERVVHHLHYTAWPDFGVPSNALHLLHFRRRISQLTPKDAGPSVIHCSAGVGRTGTLILIDAAIAQIDAEQRVDLFTFLNQIREERMKLVQTDAQYAFAHKAVLEHIKFGVTEMSVGEFRSKVKKLKESYSVTEESPLEEEFQKLIKIPLRKDCLKHGKANLKKNKVLQIIPYDFNRVTLPLKPGVERSDYINASRIDGFERKNAFIATQGPMETTCGDFWTMIWENEVYSIVMLTKLEEKGLNTCYKYWTDDPQEPVKHGDVTITLLAKEEFNNYVIRELVIRHAQFPNEPRNLKQFQYLMWPDIGEGSPDQSDGILKILELVSERKDAHDSPLVVHCSNGGGRTGVFCCLANLVDQAEGDGMVDVFQTVMYLRQQRPHLIQTQEQYIFCYWSLLQYLENTNVDEKNPETPMSMKSNQSVSDVSSIHDVDNMDDDSSIHDVNNESDVGSVRDVDTKDDVISANNVMLTQDDATTDNVTYIDEQI